MKDRVFNQTVFHAALCQWNPLTHVALTGLALAAMALSGQTATYTWDVRSGLWPYEVDETMRLVNDSPLQPVLTTNSLLLQNDAVNQAMSCIQTSGDLQFSTRLVIEAELKFETNTAHLPNFEAATGVGITFIPYQAGNSLFFDRDVISLLPEGGGSGRGPSANVDTDDAFHRYRIEVDAPYSGGSTIRVYQDGILSLTGQLRDNVPGGDRPMIWFGDGASGPFGKSQWRYFRHNAAARTPGPRLSIQTAVELCWWAETNKSYQIQWASRLGTNDWMNWGPQIVGDDSTRCFFDSSHGQSQKIYRLLELP